jgi:hypothetical protein
MCLVSSFRNTVLEVLYILIHESGGTLYVSSHYTIMKIQVERMGIGFMQPSKCTVASVEGRDYVVSCSNCACVHEKGIW